MLGSSHRESAALLLQKEFIWCWGMNSRRSHTMKKKQAHFVSPKVFLHVDTKCVDMETSKH